MPILSDAELLEAWRAGIDDFNRRRYWHAHEGWERGWVRLAEPRKGHLQALIQACGVMHLLELEERTGDRRRLNGARSLCAAARAKLLAAAEPMRAHAPRVEIPGLEAALRELAAHIDRRLAGESAGIASWRAHADALRAHLVLPRPPRNG